MVRFQRIGFLLAGTLLVSIGVGIVAQQHRDGYSDTPMLPGQPWHVHDPARPYPKEVIPGKKPGDPPSDALVLFDGKDLSHFVQTDTGDEFGKPHPPKWKLVNHCIEVVPGTGYLYTVEKFGDCQLHLEWQEDAKVTGSGQGRGNSGVFMMSRYEIQVLDSYRSPTYADGQAAAIYGQWPPLVNPMRPPGQWQTYDIVFHAPKWDGDTLVQPAYVTVFFNGVLVHDHQKINGPTAHRQILPYIKQAPEERIGLQDHGPSRPLRFRNIWVRRLQDYDQPETDR